MKTETRHALKQDKFAQAAASGASWLSDNKSSVVRWTISIAVVVVLVVGGAILFAVRTAAADRELGAAVDAFGTALASPEAPDIAGVYKSAADRAKAANTQFVAIASKYSWLKQGKTAEYFAGITYQEMGQTAQAETALKSAAGAWNRDLANLAKIALAGIYHQSSRDGEAETLYNQIIAKPSSTVTAAAAQLNLAELYVSQGKTDQARAIWAKVQEADKQGAAGEIAAQKLQVK